MPLHHTLKEVELDNGAKGLFIDVPGSSSVHYDIQFRAGGNFAADQKKSQVAHIMEHLAFGSNAQYDSMDAFSRKFSKRGARHNALTSNLEMIYNVDASLSEWERILDLQLLAITQPVYKQETLDAEKGNVREELIGYATNHRRVLWQEIMKASGLKRGYDPEKLKTVDPVTLEDIQQHFDATHTTHNMRFVIAGDLAEHHDAIIEKLEKVPLKKGELLSYGQETARETGPVCITRKDLPNLNFQLTFLIDEPYREDEYAPFRILSHVLTDTFHSRIFGEARNRGICYHLFSYFQTTPMGVTEFTFGGQVGMDNIQAVFELIAEQLLAVAKNGISEKELKDAKAFRNGSLEMSRETARSLAGWYQGLYTSFGYIDHLDSIPKRINTVTVKEVRDAARMLVACRTWTLGGIGNITKAEFKKYHDVFDAALGKEVQ